LAERSQGATADKLIGYLCLGNWALGFSDGVPAIDRTQLMCPTCLISRHTSEIGKSGASKRHGPMAALRSWAIDRYREGKWASANQAAFDLMESVIAHGRTINANLSPANAQRTIAEWFRKSA
jgi:hypothetical protein